MLAARSARPDGDRTSEPGVALFEREFCALVTVHRQWAVLIPIGGTVFSWDAEFDLRKALADGNQKERGEGEGEGDIPYRCLVA